MNHRDRPARDVRLRGFGGAALLVLGFTGLTTVLTWGTGGAVAAVRAPGSAPVDAAVALAAALGAWLLLAWLVGGAVVALVAAAVAGVGSRAFDRTVALSPAAGRRLVGALLGLALAGAPLAAGLPAGAAEHGVVVTTDQVDSAHPGVGSTGVAGGVPAAGSGPIDLDRPAAVAPPGWSPDRPAARHRRSAGSETAVRLVATTPHAEHGVLDEVVVHRGDSLWDIAARHLGSSPDAAEVAAEWPRWYAANRHVIGADPDLLRPGQRLAPPA
jgi:nucleoid-associated protein YgaU